MAVGDGQWFHEQIILVKEWADDVAGKAFGIDAWCGHGQMNHRCATDAQLQVAPKRGFYPSRGSELSDFPGRTDAPGFPHVNREDIGSAQVGQSHGILKGVKA